MQKYNSWNIAIAGELMVTRPFAMHDERSFLALRDLMQESDLTYAHLEMNLGDFSNTGWPARGDWFGSYMMADGKIAEDLRWLGIDMMSLANNHSLDLGAKGLMSTRERCEQQGIGHAGTGRDLEEAREPAFVETARGRVALISVSSGNKQDEWAGLPKGTMPGRPGINPLRVDTRYHLDAQSAEELKSVSERLGILRLPGKRVAGTAGRPMAPNEFKLAFPGEQGSNAAQVFVEGAEECRVVTECNVRDLEANIRSVEEGAQMADLVMVAHHFNISETGRGDTPPGFVRDFAHRCIDAGADIFVGHGWHKTLGIEIYKGRPIFYGLGNFFAQSEFIRRVPYDSYETWGHDMDRLNTLTPAVHPLHPGLDNSSETWWSSAVFSVKFEDGVLREVQLHPVELGREPTAEKTITRTTGKGPEVLTEGRPLLATGEAAQRILQRLQRVSEPFGTDIQIENGVGILRIPVESVSAVAEEREDVLIS